MDTTSMETQALRDALLGGSIPSLQFFRLWRTSEDTRFFAKSAKGRFVSASPNVLAVNGLAQEEEIIRLSDHDFFPAGMADRFRGADLHVVNSGRPLTGIRETILDRNGVCEHYVTDKFPMLDGLRRIVGVMGTSRRVKAGDAVQGAGGNDLEPVLNHMRGHFQEDIPMQRLAAMVGVSQRQFHRLFRSHFGISPNQYLIRMRVLAARDLLLSDRRTVAEIAYALGFCDDTLFIRQFKSRMGMTPLQYRKSNG